MAKYLVLFHYVPHGGVEILKNVYIESERELSREELEEMVKKIAKEQVISYTYANVMKVEDEIIVPGNE